MRDRLLKMIEAATAIRELAECDDCFMHDFDAESYRKHVREIDEALDFLEDTMAKERERYAPRISTTSYQVERQGPDGDWFFVGRPVFCGYDAAVRMLRSKADELGVPCRLVRFVTTREVVMDSMVSES